MKILVLDGNLKAALAIVRNIEGDIDVASLHKHPITKYSRYVNKHIYMCSYIEELPKLVDSYDVIMPVGTPSFKACIELSWELANKSLLPRRESFNIAIDKAKTYAFVGGLNCVHVPAYWVIDNDFVVKPKIEQGHTCVSYHKPSLVQDYIEGTGYGFFALYVNGKCKQWFCHRRIREYPASGGVSVCAESVRDYNLVHKGKTILDALKWNGVAMVEFRKSRMQGDYWLMEINPKFWGSLDLSISCGINFPQLYIDAVLGKDIQGNELYPMHRRFQWILNGEVPHLLQRPKSLRKVLTSMFYSHNDIKLRDIKPNLWQLVYLCKTNIYEISIIILGIITLIVSFIVLLKYDFGRTELDKHI